MATESTPLLQAPHLADDINGLSFSARRQSLNAIAGGRQSEFGGPNQGLDDFRSIVARNRLLSRSEQRETITEQVRHIISDEPSLLAMPASRLDATTYVREAGLLVAWGTPQIIIGFCRYSIVGATIFSLGKLGTRELAAANLGFLSSNVGGYALIIGLVSALDTLANQAGKSASPKLASLYAMRTFIVCMCFMPFIFLFMWNALPFFKLVIPASEADEEILVMASNYLRVMSLSMPAVAGYECLRRYLQSFGMMTGPALAFAIASPVSIFLNWLLVHGPEGYRIGFLGGPVAATVAYNLLFVLIVFYTLLAAPKGSWNGFTKAIFEDLGTVLIFGLAGIASVCSEWFAFEAIGFAATLFSPATQAAAAIYSTTISLFYQVPMGLGSAGAIRVGNLLGRGLPAKAARTALAGQVLTTLVMVVSCIFLVVFRERVGILFSNDQDVLDIVAENIWLLVVIITFDGVQGINSGILRGAGLPTAAARINLMSYWLLGLPIGILATWKLKSVGGLYTGLAAAVVVATAWMSYMIWRNAWDVRAAEAMARISIQDYDAKVIHTPPNELSGVIEEEEDDEDSAAPGPSRV